MQIYQNKILSEKYFYEKHSSGLNVYIYPKKGYTTYYAIIGTRYGSINERFRLGSELVDTPAGVAHFLEHKLFECQNGDAFEMFSKTGASANAYTSFDKTAYLFSCSENFYESLEILLGFVQEPYFTELGVEKEKGIIGQEIKMYSDSPGWKVTFNLLNALYRTHPVREDIAGSIGSIARITPRILKDCYDTFYDLSNMTLCLVGDLDVNEALDFVFKKIKKKSRGIKLENLLPTEPNEIENHLVIENMEVINPIFSLGFKHEVSGKHMSCKEMIISEMILDFITLKSRDLYSNLLQKRLITDNGLDTELFCGPYYKASIFSGESNNPEEVAEMIREEIYNIATNCCKVEEFERTKRYYYSHFVTIFDKISSIANIILNFDFAGYKLFDFVETIEKITPDDLNHQICKDFGENWSLSVIKKN